jgi:hypothetical protein
MRCAWSPRIVSLLGRYARIEEMLRGAAATGEPDLAELW